MSTIRRLIFALTILGKFVFSQRFIDDECKFQSTGLSGVCKLFKDCQQAREELRKYSKFPQTCGFQGNQTIVCCPNTERRPQRRKPGEISIQKCRENAKYLFEKKKSPVLLINSPEVITNKCGHKVVKLIVGGEPAGRREFPHMAAVGFEPTPGNIEWSCGGTILSEEYVLTASHCLSDYSQGDAQWVRLGVTDLTDSKHRQEIKIAERIFHPQYKPSSHYHDIGLIKLENPARLNPYATPACLYLEPEVDTEKAIATGWGQTSWAGQGSNKLLKTTIGLVDHDYCNSSYKNHITSKLRNGIVNDIQLCAGSENEKNDTCQGDSGGPLQIYHIGDDIKCMYDIIGVTSFGKSCSGSPGVYVRVSHYVKWIEDIVWP